MKFTLGAQAAVLCEASCGWRRLPEKISAISGAGSKIDMDEVQ